MSLCRKITSLFSFGLFDQKSTTAEKRENWRLSQLRWMPVAILGFLHEAMAGSSTIFANETSTNTNYQIVYDPDKFANFEKYLIQYGNPVLSGTSNLFYYYYNSDYCKKDGEAPGPGIQLSVEIAKNLTQSFQSTLNQVMGSVCQEYYDLRDAQDNRTTLVMLACVIGVGLIGAGVLTGIRHCKRDDPGLTYEAIEESPSSTSSFSSTDSNTYQHSRY